MVRLYPKSLDPILFSLRSRSPSGGKRLLRLCGFFLTCLLLACSPNQTVILEDYHTGTYFEVLRNLDLEESYTMINLDAHSDSNTNSFTDEIRSIVADRNHPLEERLNILKEKNYFEVYSWLDPLLGTVVTDYNWLTLLGPEDFPWDQREEYHRRRTDESQWGLFKIDYWEPAFPYPVGPSILTVDLDAFQPFEPEEGRQLARAFWGWAAGQPWDLITTAVSTPYHDSIAQAEEILLYNLQAMVEAGFTIEIKASERYGIDLSRPARLAYYRGEPIPLLNWGKPSRLREYIQGQSDKITFRPRTAKP
jgi:hypothetical protein